MGQVKRPFKMERIVRRICSSQSVSWKNDFLSREAGNRDETLNSNSFISSLNYEQSTLDKPRHLSVCVCRCGVGKRGTVDLNKSMERKTKQNKTGHHTWPMSHGRSVHTLLWLCHSLEILPVFWNME